MTDARDPDDEPFEAAEPEPLDPDAGVEAEPADVLEQAQPLAGAPVTDLADAAGLPFDDPAEEARLREDALEAEPPA